jgi:hypothetical protein
MKKLIFVACALALGGCAAMTPAQMDQNSASAFQGAPLTTVTYQKPGFSAMTYGRVAAGALFGAVGGAIAGATSVSAGDQIIQDNQVPDPAIAIMAEVSPKISERLKTSTTIALTEQASNDEKKLATAAGNKGVVLDVQTLSWQFIYFPLDWGHYRVLHFARARLIDAATGKVLGLVPCKYDSGDDKSVAPPDYDTLLADNAAVLKAKLAAATSACAAKIESTMLGG